LIFIRVVILEAGIGVNRHVQYEILFDTQSSKGFKALADPRSRFESRELVFLHPDTGSEFFQVRQT
jgi:hypothetical protein